jgi:hypothetical protein
MCPAAPCCAVNGSSGACSGLRVGTEAHAAMPAALGFLRSCSAGHLVAVANPPASARAAMLAVLVILLLEVTTGQGVLTHWLQL